MVDSIMKEEKSTHEASATRLIKRARLLLGDGKTTHVGDFAHGELHESIRVGNTGKKNVYYLCVSDGEVLGALHYVHYGSHKTNKMAAVTKEHRSAGLVDAMLECVGTYDPNTWHSSGRILTTIGISVARGAIVKYFNGTHAPREIHLCEDVTDIADLNKINTIEDYDELSMQSRGSSLFVRIKS